MGYEKRRRGVTDFVGGALGAVDVDVPLVHVGFGGELDFDAFELVLLEVGIFLGQVRSCSERRALLAVMRSKVHTLVMRFVAVDMAVLLGWGG